MPIISPKRSPAEAWKDYCAFAQKRGLPPCTCCGFPAASQRDVDCCPACHYQAGHTQDIDKHRQIWTESGSLWRCLQSLPPKGWDPVHTLGALALKISLSKVKGRPPRMLRMPSA